MHAGLDVEFDPSLSTITRTLTTPSDSVAPQDTVIKLKLSGGMLVLNLLEAVCAEVSHKTQNSVENMVIIVNGIELEPLTPIEDVISMLSSDGSASAPVYCQCKTSSAPSQSDSSAMSGSGYGCFAAPTKPGSVDQQSILEMLHRLQSEVSALREERDRDRELVSMRDSENRELRSKLAECYLNTDKKNRTLIQKVVRGWLQRRKYQRVRRRAATNIQRLLRGHKLRAELGVKHGHATVIQCLWRGQLARTRQQARQACGTKVQQILRGFLARAGQERRQQSSVRIQRCFREHQESLPEQFGRMYAKAATCEFQLTRKSERVRQLERQLDMQSGQLQRCTDKAAAACEEAAKWWEKSQVQCLWK